jgi:hypothetical protein
MNLPQKNRTRPHKGKQIAVIILLSWFILGFAQVSYNNGSNFKVEMLERGQFRITPLQPGAVSSQVMGSGSNYLLNCFENGRMVIYAWMKPGGTLMVSADNHHLRITLDHNYRYKIEEDPY